jgi:hypothetical protein
MNRLDFNKLDLSTKASLIIAMHIRNEMEDFHCKHLSDEQMQEKLNPLIRQAVYNTPLLFINILLVPQNYF